MDATYLPIKLSKFPESFLSRLTLLNLDGEHSGTGWAALAPLVAACPLECDEETLQVCLARLEDWLLASSNLDTSKATISLMLHQNPLWVIMANCSETGAGEERRKRLSHALAYLRAHWRHDDVEKRVRPLILRWLDADFIIAPNLLTQLVKIEQNTLVDDKR